MHKKFYKQFRLPLNNTQLMLKNELSTLNIIESGKQLRDLNLIETCDEPETNSHINSYGGASCCRIPLVYRKPGE